MLITASQQDNQFAPLLLEIDPIAGTVVNPKFRDTLTDRLNITGIPKHESFDSSKNSSTCSNITQAINPFGKCLSFSDFHFQ